MAKVKNEGTKSTSKKAGRPVGTANAVRPTKATTSRRGPGRPRKNEDLSVGNTVSRTTPRNQEATSTTVVVWPKNWPTPIQLAIILGVALIVGVMVVGR